MSAPASRIPSNQEFTVASGRRVVVASADSVHSLRKQTSNNPDGPEVVVRGSQEHKALLQEAQQHHAQRRAHLKERHGADFDEWEDVHNQLNSVSAQLSRLSRSTSASLLHHNYGKFGYDKGIRTYDEGGDNEAQQGQRDDDGDEPDELGAAVDHDNLKREGYRQESTIKLAKVPVVKQWFHQQTLWRASEQTEIMAIELFFDLVYVGIIHSNGEHMSEEPTGFELLRFAVTFIMSWKIWTDITMNVSWFETDDVLTRCEMLFEIACLLGFTTNMTNCFVDDPEHNTYTALVSFYLAARLLFALYYIIVARLVPMIRGAMISSAIPIFIGTALWIGSIYVEMPVRLALIWPALLVDTYGSGVFVGLFRYARSAGDGTALAKRLNSWFEFYPAMNIEHKVERMNAFVSLVLGYSVVAILFQSNGGYNINAFLGKAVLALMQAFLVNWLYFDVDASTIKAHAIRHSANGAILWQFAHLPFIMAYIVATSALSTLVLATDVPGTEIEQLSEADRPRSEEHFPLGVRFFYCHGLAIALLSMGLISLSHAHRSPTGMRLAKKYRLANRLAVCLIMFLLPLAQDLRSLDLISITLGLVVWVLVVELWGKSCKGDSWFAIGGTGLSSRRMKNKAAPEDNPNVGHETPMKMEADQTDAVGF